MCLPPASAEYRAVQESAAVARLPAARSAIEHLLLGGGVGAAAAFVHQEPVLERALQPVVLLPALLVR